MKFVNITHSDGEAKVLLDSVVSLRQPQLLGVMGQGASLGKYPSKLETENGSLYHIQNPEYERVGKLLDEAKIDSVETVSHDETYKIIIVCGKISALEKSLDKSIRGADQMYKTMVSLSNGNSFALKDGEYDTLGNFLEKVGEEKDEDEGRDRPEGRASDNLYN